MVDSPHLEIQHEHDAIWLVAEDERRQLTGLRPQELLLLIELDLWNRQHNYLLEPCSFETLARALWSDRDPFDVKPLIIRLVKDIRDKIEPEPTDPVVLVNVRRKGYILNSRPYFRLEDYPHFVVGRPVRHPRYFFGRDAELRQIFSGWKPSGMLNTAVIGPKGAGKTSLLHFIKNIHATPEAQLREEQTNDWLPNPERFRFVLVDFKDPRMRSPDRMLEHILLGLDINPPDPCDLVQCLDLVERELVNPGVILLDDIGRALAEPGLDENFWSGIRTLGSGRLGFVVSGRESPLRMAKAVRKDSPFFNTFLNSVSLGPLPRSAAIALIESSPVAFDPGDVDWIVDMSELWTGPLQVCCDVLLKAHQGHLALDTWRNVAREALGSFSHLLTR